MDAIKAFAIFLVVYGHSIQYISGVDFWNNRIFQIVYSVHMPLFFAISGFFFVGQENKTFLEFLKRKSLTLLLPCFVWATLSAFVSLVTGGDFLSFVLKIINPLGWPFWFLKGLFVVQLIAWICLWVTKKLAKRHFVIWAAVLSLVVFLVPGAYVARVMLPIFLGGWFLRQHYDWLQTHLGITTLVSGMIYIIFLLFWNSEGMRFYSGTSLSFYGCFNSESHPWNDWMMLLYRIVLGLSGSFFVIGIFHYLKQVPQWIQIIGISTEAIYILQACLVEHLIGGFIAQKTDWLVSIQGLPLWLLFGMVLPILSIGFVLLCTLIYQQTKYVPYAGRILFGGAYVRV